MTEGGMKKFCILAALMLLTGLPGCQTKQDPALTGLIFDRGSGSEWGNQLYIEVNSGQIVTLRYVSQETGQLETLEQIPIQPEQWEAIAAALGKLELQKDTASWKDWLLGSSKLDGGQYRKLSLIYDAGGKETQTDYRWPDSPEAGQLEAMLETLADFAGEASAGKLYDTGAFSVWIPGGWSALPEKDLFSDSPNGEKTDCLNIIKGGATEQDLHARLYIRLDYYPSGQAVPEPPLEIYQNVQKIAPMQLGQHTWQGFVAEELQGRVVLGKVAVLQTQTQQGSFMASCWLERGREVITLEDAQVQAILESVTPASQ